MTSGPTVHEQLLEVRRGLDGLQSELGFLAIELETHSQHIDDIAKRKSELDARQSRLVEAVAMHQADPLTRAVEFLSLGKLTIGPI